jgi:hypothetical protein
MTWVLAVDFGTTNTVAAIADATGVRVLNVNGMDRFEECVDVPVTALFRPLLAEALEQHGGKPPDLFIVTHPATWTASRIDLLLSAAAAAAPGKAKWPNPQALAEPVAAAQRVPHLANTPATSRVPLQHGDPATAVAEGAAHHGWDTLHGEPAEPPAPPGGLPEKKFRAIRTKAALLVALLLLLAGGGIFTYVGVLAP